MGKRNEFVNQNRLKKLLEINSQINVVVLLLCDQPFVNRETIFRLIRAFHETGKSIAASEYLNITGVPAIFSREIFDELLNLQGDAGARFVIKKFAASTAKVSVPEAAIDIDSPEDVLKLRTEN